MRWIDKNQMGRNKEVKERLDECERGRKRGGAGTCINILKLTFINPVLWLVGLIGWGDISADTESGSRMLAEHIGKFNFSSEQETSSSSHIFDQETE